MASIKVRAHVDFVIILHEHYLAAVLAKSRFHTACQDYKTAFIGCNDNICIGFFFIFVLHKLIFKKLKSLIRTTEVFWTANLMKNRQNGSTKILKWTAIRDSRSTNSNLENILEKVEHIKFAQVWKKKKKCCLSCAIFCAIFYGRDIFFARHFPRLRYFLPPDTQTCMRIRG